MHACVRSSLYFNARSQEVRKTFIIKPDVRPPPPPHPEIWPQCNYTIEIIDIECVLNHESCLAPLFLKCAVINSPYLI